MRVALTALISLIGGATAQVQVSQDADWLMASVPKV